MADTDNALSSNPMHPRFTGQLFGQDVAEATLLSAVRSGRLAHGWMLAGPQGIGKATLAYRFARYLLAGMPEGLSMAVPEDSPIFRRVASMGHGDLLTIERTPNPKTGKMRKDISAEEARRLPDFFTRTAAEGGYRVAIVDAADDMNMASANALLKILEEPPARSVILVIAHAPGALLPTIRSRCRRLDLRPLDTAAMDAFFDQRLPDLSAQERAGLLRLADGSPGQALRLQTADGMVAFNALMEVLQAITNSVAVHEFTDRLIRRRGEGDAFDTTVELLLWWLGRAIRVIATGEMVAPVSESEVVLLQQLRLSRANADQWLDCRHRLIALFERLDAVNLDRKQVLLTAFSAIRPLLSI